MIDRRVAGMVAVLAYASTAHAAAGDLLSAELLVTEHSVHRVPMLLSRPPDCPDNERCVAGAATAAGLAVLFALGPGQRALPFSVQAIVSTPMTVRAISLRLVFSADALSVLGRDYRPTRIANAFLDRFDPKWIAMHQDNSAAEIIVDDDVDSVHVSLAHDRVVVELELLSSAARPFSHLPRCGRVWRDIHGHVGMLDRFLHAGDHLTASGELILGEVAPIAISPWPGGRAAAFVITDHADQTSATTLRVLLTGASDGDLDHPTAGLLGHAIAITKALFLRGVTPHGWTRAQLEDPAVAELADRMRAAGSEIVPHSATPLPDSRAETDAALVWFAAHDARVWIDHQPQTNCEGFGQSGWKIETGISDLLAKRGFRDVWDLTEWNGAHLDERDPEHLDKRAPTIWPLGRLQANGPNELWMFRSTWAFLPIAGFLAKYNEAALDRLEQDRGIHIAHTYLETLHPRRTYFGRRNLLVRGAERITLDPRFDAFLADLQKRSERGSLWVAPIGRVADRLRLLSEVRLRLTEQGSITIARPAGLDELTILGAAPFNEDPEVAGQHAGSGWIRACDAACTTELVYVGDEGGVRSAFIADPRIR